MKSKEALKSICLECEREKGKNKIACPFRSISNEYCEEYDTIEKDLDQLEEYRKIEKELGIDLITLFNIDKQLNTKKEIWFKIEDEIDASYRYDGDYYIIDLKHKAFVKMCCEPIDYFYFKDYGKTWALTKEELEDD